MIIFSETIIATEANYLGTDAEWRREWNTFQNMVSLAKMVIKSPLNCRRRPGQTNWFFVLTFPGQRTNEKRLCQCADLKVS